MTYNSSHFQQCYANNSSFEECNCMKKLHYPIDVNIYLFIQQKLENLRQDLKQCRLIYVVEEVKDQYPVVGVIKEDYNAVKTHLNSVESIIKTMTAFFNREYHGASEIVDYTDEKFQKMFLLVERLNNIAGKFNYLTNQELFNEVVKVESIII